MSDTSGREMSSDELDINADAARTDTVSVAELPMEGFPEGAVIPVTVSPMAEEPTMTGEVSTNQSPPAGKEDERPKPPSAQNPAERRSTQRHPVKWRAAVEMGSSIIYGHTIDVSMGGAGVLVASNIPPHRSAKLHLQLPPAYFGAEQEVISIEGKVAYATLSGHHGGFLIGVEFKKEAPGIARLARHFKRTSASVAKMASGF